ncbi:hypothetical protein EVAR_33825_1 [Eumeta japonica]|uniref:Uncharacterized protein n=1 Tax=Eumeta variegata TaxID=151549 RepID=A0A4C1VBD0_EUMVA|nr:hypothetical protein EVAR_33825_1 [Eumeta japonica]
MEMRYHIHTEYKHEIAAFTAFCISSKEQKLRWSTPTSSLSLLSAILFPPKSSRWRYLIHENLPQIPPVNQGHAVAEISRNPNEEDVICMLALSHLTVEAHPPTISLYQIEGLELQLLLVLWEREASNW